MHDFFIFITMYDALSPKMIFKYWERTEDKWFLSTPLPPRIVDNSTIDEKLENFKNYKTGKCYLVDYMIEFNKNYIHKLDSIRKITNEIFPNMTLLN